MKGRLCGLFHCRTGASRFQERKYGRLAGALRMIRTRRACRTKTCCGHRAICGSGMGDPHSRRWIPRCRAPDRKRPLSGKCGRLAGGFRLPGAAAGTRAAPIRDAAVVPIGMTMTVRSRTVSSRNAPSSRTGNAGSRKAMSRGPEQTLFGASAQAERSPPSGTFQQDEPVS